MRNARRLLPALLLLALVPGVPTVTGEGEAPADGANGNTVVEFTERLEGSVERGIAWLLGCRNPDGSWGIDPGQPGDIGCTATAALALMSHGSTPRGGPHAREVRAAMRYILDRAQFMPPDDITFETHTQLQYKMGRHIHTFLASLFLSEALWTDMRPEAEERIRNTVRKLIVRVDRSQQADGSWEGGWARVLSTATAYLSLRSADSAGISVRQANYDKTIEFLTTRLQAGGGGSPSPLYEKAAIIRVLYGVGHADSDAARAATGELIRMIQAGRGLGTYNIGSAGGEEYLALWLTTEALVKEDTGADWRIWYPRCRDMLIDVQNADGSWTGHHCVTSRVFSTAASLLALQTPNRLLPIAQR